MNRINTGIRTTVLIAGLSAAIAAPINVSYAGEGPFERGGKNVFEQLREKREKRALTTKTPKSVKASAENSVAKKTRKKRVPRPHSGAGNS